MARYKPKKNPSEALKRQREYYAKNRAKRREWNRDWIAKNRDRYNASKFIYRDKLKREAIEIYSNGRNECAICGENDIDVLCLDHINDDGAEHRRKIKISGRSTSGTSTHAALKREGWPGGIQVLCANCNLKKQVERSRRKRMENRFYRDFIEKGVMPSVHTDQDSA